MTDLVPAPDESDLPRRYAPRRDLPSYRYAPGWLPHPSADPEGHSYGKPEPDVPHFPAEQWALDEEYLYGVDLFNRRYYWEAHEAWEYVWHGCDKARTQGLFVQGLIQLSAALLKWHLGSEAGTRKLYENAMQKFAPARRESPDSYMGIPVAAWLEEVEHCFDTLLVAPPGTRPPPDLPLIRLGAQR